LQVGTIFNRYWAQGGDLLTAPVHHRTAAPLISAAVPGVGGAHVLGGAGPHRADGLPRGSGRRIGGSEAGWDGHATTARADGGVVGPA